MNTGPLPRLLIIDDLFGRRLADGQVNEDRAHLCGRFLLRDVTGDESTLAMPQIIKRPIADVVFARGQTPVCAARGDFVQNDLDGTMSIIREGWNRRCDRWSLVLLDLCFYTGLVGGQDNLPGGMPGGRPEDSTPSGYFGLKILRKIYEELPDLPVVILSSKPRESASRAYAELGALGFLARADEGSPERLSEFIWRDGLIPDSSGEIVGYSKPLLMALRAARRAGGDRRNVLVLGERGTGKELMARYLHRSSHVSRHLPLTIVDSGTLSPALYASELFGYRRGSFTGADHNHIGKISQANGGDLFLDEIGNMPADVQGGLLRVLEHRSVTPLGSNTAEDVNVRFFSATNEDLEGRAATGGFRQDLLDRLRDGGTVFLRPLRERLEDLEALAETFVRQAEAAHHTSVRRIIEPSAIDKLLSYSWPGNLRELRSCIFNAVFNYPYLEHLMPVHLSVNDELRQAPNSLSAVLSSEQVATDFTAVLAQIREFDFETVSSQDIVGRLSEAEYAQAHFLLGLIRAAFSLTMRRTPEHPEGQLMIHPAMKLLTGDKTISASKSADLVKRIFALNRRAKLDALADTVLSVAYEKATRLRPSRIATTHVEQNVGQK